MLERLAVFFWRIGMPSILVVEQEPHSVERINAALGAEGWRVRVVPSVDQALHAASAEPPDLVMAGTDVPGFEVLTFSFLRRSGGPGVVALDPGNGAGPAGAADAPLAKPFTDQQVVLAARQALLARRQPTPAPTAPEQKLTSKDIFGDVLAEVEGDMPPRPVIAPPRAAPPPPPAADVQRRLEETLSGVLGTELKPKPAPAAPPRRAEPAAGDVDALLSKTLSNLDLGKTKTGVRSTGPQPIVRPPAPPPPVPPPPMAAAPVAPAPAPPQPPPPVSEGTGVRKGRTVGDFDFAELEELAHPTRPASQGTGVRPIVPAPVPVPPPPVAITPPPPMASAPPPRMAPPEPAPLPFAAPPELPPPPPIPSGVSVAESPMATQRIPVFDEAGDQPGERFGQYTLLERIPPCGMAAGSKARLR